MKSIVQQYLKALEEADLSAVLALFAADAVIYSPIYGIKSAEAFYRILFADTTTSITRIQSVFEDTVSNTTALYFIYDWTLANGKSVQFHCVDIFQFNADLKIQSLRIIYDTQEARVAREA